jgi:hypothetical protein
LSTARNLRQRGLEFVREGVRYVSVRGPASAANEARGEVSKRVPLMQRPPVNITNSGSRRDVCDSCGDPMGPDRDGRLVLCELCELARYVSLKGDGG